MRYLLHTVALLFLLSASAYPQLVEKSKLTDAERMDLAGPVRSVSSTVRKTDVTWQQPGGPTLVFPIWCSECEFDPEGNQLKSGSIFEGVFRGEISEVVRDSNGQVIERLAKDPSTGKIIRHEVIGPFGKTEEAFYNQGQLQSRNTFSYDQYGHMIDWLTLDADGIQKARTIVNTDKEGKDTEQWDWGKDDELRLHVRQTFDPKTKIEHFTKFDEFGGVSLTWNVVGGKLESFWELPDSKSQYGDNFSEDVGNNTFENYQCHSDGTCELSRIHYVYLDAKRRNPESAEWRDADGNLRFAAYYDYEIDVHRNWTHRRIWVWSQSLGERKLYETDSRSLTYWPQ